MAFSLLFFSNMAVNILLFVHRGESFSISATSQREFYQAIPSGLAVLGDEFVWCSVRLAYSLYPP